MTDATPAGYPAVSSPIRTLAVRITDDLRAQLDVIAQLNDRSVTEEIRIALEAWVEASKSDPKVLQRAEKVRADIEREAETKRNAISSIFGASAPSSGSSRGRNKQHLKTPEQLAAVSGIENFESSPEQLPAFSSTDLTHCCSAALQESHLVRRPLAARR